MGEHQAGNQSGLTVASRLALYCNAGCAAAVWCKMAINGLDEFALPRLELHLGAGQDSFRHRGELKKRNHTLDARKPLLLPRQSARAHACGILPLSRVSPSETHSNRS